jgi:alpha-N-acetylglucosaminidase
MILCWVRAIETFFLRKFVQCFSSEFSWTGQSRHLDDWWLKWSTRRYGVTNSAAQKYWNVLANTMLNIPTTCAQRIQMPAISVVPSMEVCEFCCFKKRFSPLKSCQFPQPTCYNSSTMKLAWALLLQANLIHTQTYLNDVVEITRQNLGDLGNQCKHIISFGQLYSLIIISDYAQMVSSYNSKSVDAFKSSASRFLDVARDMDAILATQSMFLLGTWVEAAQNFSRSDSLQQLTYWAFPSDSLNDYAVRKTTVDCRFCCFTKHCKQSKLWSGLVSSYYIPRWTMFVDAVVEAMSAGVAFNQNAFETQLWDFQRRFVNDNNESYSTTPIGNTMKLSSALFAKYSGMK